MHDHSPQLLPSRHLARAADKELMPLVRAGDRRALAVLYDRHRRHAYFVAYRILGDRQEAEDVVQDAFLGAWKGAGGYRAEKGNALNWILGAVNNRAVDRLRSRESRRRTWEKAAAVAPQTQPDEAFPLLWHAIRRGAQRGRLREALGALPPEQREVLALVHVDGLTQMEIARRLRLPLGTVKGRVRLAMKRLRGHFGAETTA